MVITRPSAPLSTDLTSGLVNATERDDITECTKVQNSRHHNVVNTINVHAQENG